MEKRFLLSFKGILFIFSVLTVSACSTTPVGYTNSGFPFYVQRIKYPCAYKGFYSKSSVETLNNNLDRNRYFDKRVVSISGTSDSINKGISLNQAGDKITCHAELTFSNGSKEDGFISYSKGINDTIVVTWMSDHDSLVEKAKEKEAALVAEEDWQKSFPFNEYPYMAFLSCSSMGYKSSLLVCYFNRNLTSSFEIKNGDDYSFYKGHEIQRAGNPKEGDLRIPLKNNFFINTQNVSRHHVLNIKIVDRRNNSLVFEKSAGMFDYISVKN